MEAKDYATIIKSVSSALNVNAVDNTMVRNVATYCKSLNLNKLISSHKTKDEMLQFIADAYVKSIAKKDDFDFHSYIRQKHEESSDHKSSDKRVKSLTDWISQRMPVLSSKTMSVLLDSRMRNSGSTSPITDFVFSLVPRNVRGGGIPVREIPSQITYLKIGKIVLPYSATLRDRNFTREMTLTFTAIRSNGIIANQDTYHFTFTYIVSTTNSGVIELTPNNEYCKFNPPLRTLEDMSIRFNDPIYPVAFPSDRIAPIEFVYTSSDGRIVFDKPHGLIDGDIVVISGLTTGNDATNSTLLTSINDPRGLRVQIIDEYIIMTGIDFRGIVLPDENALPLVLIYSRMFRFSVEIGHHDVEDIQN